MNSHLRRKKRRAAERSWKRMQAMLKDVYESVDFVGRPAYWRAPRPLVYEKFLDVYCNPEDPKLKYFLLRGEQ